jgi:hypothetical protein
LRADIVRTLHLLGCPSVQDLDASFIESARSSLTQM